MSNVFCLLFDRLKNHLMDKQKQGKHNRVMSQRNLSSEC